MPVTVVLADDQDLIRSGLRMMLDAEPEVRVVAEARNGLEAIDAVGRHRTDVVLMDVEMPVLDGLSAARRILSKRREPAVRVIMLTTFDLDRYVFEALRAGASGYLLKSIRPEELARAVLTVAAGDALLAPSVTRRLLATFARGNPTPAHTASLGALTAREGEVLRRIARGRSNAEIAGDLSLSTTTVKTHVANLLTKLDQRDRTQLAVFAYESGYVRAGDG